MSLSVTLRKQLGGFCLNVSFEAADAAQTLALLGASGSGKSMALKCIAGIEQPDEGRIVLNGRVLFDSAQGISVPVQQRRVGYLFQNFALFPSMTVEQNVMAGVREGTRAERRERAAAQIRAFRLEGLERHRPSELSGGQQQRCALARIMANEPELLLLDEPFSALDGYLRWQLELELSETLKRFPGGVVFVTHSRDEAYRLCDQVCVLTEGASGRTMPTHVLFEAPETRAEALISGCKNVSSARAVGPHELECLDWGVTLGCARAVEGCTSAGVRAHFLRIVEADGRAVEAYEGTRSEFGAAGAGGMAAGEAAADAAGTAGAQGRTAAAVADGSSASSAANMIPCKVERVIDNVFSTIVMCATPGGSALRVELPKHVWARLGNPARVTLAVEPACVMPLKG